MKVRAKIKLFPHQMEYVMSEHPRTAIIAGYGAGKTYSNVQKTLRLLSLRNKQGIKNALIFYAAPTYDLIYSTYYIELIETLDRYRIKYHEDKQHHSIIIDAPELKGVVKLISLDKYKNLVGFTATDGILDEFDVLPVERQKATWTRALARLRGCENGTLSITTTPEGHKYCYELYKAGIIHQITASSEDNKSLPESFINDLYDCYDEAHVQMYIKGQYTNLAGLRAMYNYREEMLIDPIDVSKIGRQITVGMDFNVNPFCMTVSYMAAPKHKITFDEFYIRNAGGADGYGSFTDKAMMLLLQKYPNRWYQQNIDPSIPDHQLYDITVCPDMTGVARKTSSSITDIVILKKYLVKVVGTVNPPVSARIKIANIAMQKGIWQITKNCKNLIQDFEMCVTDEHGELLKDESKVSKDRTHILDACTYDVYQTFKDEIFTKKYGKAM